LPDKQQRFLQEFIGYSLTRDTSHNLMVMIYGTGGNGKSAFLTALKAVFGKGAYEALTLPELQGRENYKMAEIENIFINLCDEIPNERKIATDKIKNLTSGGEIIVRKIYEAPIRIAPTLKLLFCTNNLPEFTDKSDAIFRRIEILNFPNDFRDPSKQNKEFLSSDFWINSGEAEGILNWALAGLQRLLSRGHFVETDYSKEAKERYRFDLNTEMQFISDNYEFTGIESDQISTYDLYQKHKEYCSDYGYQAKNNTVFGKEVSRLFPKIKRSNPKMDQKLRKKFRFLIGIRNTEQSRLTIEYSKDFKCSSSKEVNNAK
jgi:putative DNA primase/helicase